ncbi:MAG: tRNA uridine-5-carboxymethylaminomethyl(34) synthesis enzyme MnmG [Clostridiales bacterium]|jgi:tRNA uridine 5-carboxymethylaminomethyl modification enzyme|nr:tRNA uridine-5-carboxymethylaminomethyl(34) synthesis enzyme MnmG [Clostridiales bacterium]
MHIARHYDCIVIGAGHAGTEAALASARLGIKTLILTMSPDSIAFLACNPNIGGTSKAQLVREVDALGGEMGVAADKATIQLKLLNGAKGAAVRSLRGQVDKRLYHDIIKKTLEDEPNLTILEGEAVKIISDGSRIKGIKTATGAEFYCEALVLATGVYLNSGIIIGEYTKKSGPAGFFPADGGLSDALRECGIEIRRFKTGTPPRIHKRSIDFSKMQIQEGERGICRFSFLNDYCEDEGQALCHLTYTTKETSEIIRQNISRSPMYNGSIEGIGPRYCPSIEDKIMRFSDKERHQIFIEPEGIFTNEMYVQGMSSSLPSDVQEKVLHSIIGLERAEIIRYAYAIEYDCLNPEQLLPSLAVKHLKGLFAAGQLNGTSGYEEAAAQGVIAGINAALYIKGEEPFILKRHEAYIGVLIDDVVTKGTNEPYRMMTARAEYRLSLRQDNADTRLTAKGRAIGLVSDERYERYLKKQKELKEIFFKAEKTISPDKALEKLFERKGAPYAIRGYTIKELLKRPEFGFFDINSVTGEFLEYSKAALAEAEAELKYGGYIEKQANEIKNYLKAENRPIPLDVDYSKIDGLRLEARQKLEKIRPLSIGQAMRISGVSPADISVLMIRLAVLSKA